jgi:hypothetical protein
MTLFFATTAFAAPVPDTGQTVIVIYVTYINKKGART